MRAEPADWLVLPLLLSRQTQESLNPNNLEYWMEDIYTPGYDSLLKRKEAEFRRAKLCKMGALIAAATCTVILVIVVPLCTMKTWSPSYNPGGRSLFALSYFPPAAPSRRDRNDSVSFCTKDINSASAYSIFGLALLFNLQFDCTVTSCEGQFLHLMVFKAVAREWYFYFFGNNVQCILSKVIFDELSGWMWEFTPRFFGYFSSVTASVSSQQTGAHTVF